MYKNVKPKTNNAVNTEILKEPKEIVYDAIASINGKGFRIKSTDVTFRNHVLVHFGKLPFPLLFPYYYSNIEVLTMYNISCHSEKYEMNTGKNMLKTHHGLEYCKTYYL